MFVDKVEISIKAETMKDGVALAAELIDSGKALGTLQKLIEDRKSVV